MNLKVNEELKALIPPLKEDEYKLLESSILGEGCRDKLITWNDTIVDGHNRYEICTKNGIPFQVEDRDFDSFDAVKIWMIDNQKGRRNLTDGWKWELAQTRKEILAEKGKENISANKGGTTSLSTIDKEAHNTRDEIAKELGWSTGKVAMADKVWKEAQPEVKDKIKSGETSINQAYQEIKKEQKKEEKRERFKQKKNEFAKELDISIADSFCYNGSCLDYLQGDSIDKIDLLLTDPPYAMDYKSGWNNWDKIDGDVRGDTVNLLDACFSLCQQKMNDDAHVYVFGNPNEIEYVKPIFERYFNLKNILVWDRQVIGMGDLKSYGRSYDIIYFGYNKEWKDLNGTRERDVLNYKRVSPNELIHPTEKPDDILKYLIKKSSNEGDKVFDPFAGSCSTIRNAFELNRNAYGCELQNKYIPEWMSKKI